MMKNETMNINFNNKKILVTGHTRGIGASIYNKFKSLGGNIRGISSEDVDFAHIKELIEFMYPIQQLNYDILVNCAGINEIDYVSGLDISDYKNIMAVNADAPLIISKALIPNMIKNKYGRIINVASIFGSITKEKRAAYTMSKHALIGLTKTMAVELAPYNILVNAVSPSFTETDLTKRILGEQGIEEMKKQIPIGRLAQPAEIASAVMYLCSDYNTYITGQNIIIDGGFTII